MLRALIRTYLTAGRLGLKPVSGERNTSASLGYGIARNERCLAASPFFSFLTVRVGRGPAEVGKGASSVAVGVRPDWVAAMAAVPLAVPAARQAARAPQMAVAG